MKKLFLLLIPTLMLVGCGQNSNASVDAGRFSYGELAKADLASLAVGPYMKKEDATKYSIQYSETLSKDETGFVYTVIIEYTDTKINNLRVMMCPADYLSKATSFNLPNIGYYQYFNLSDVKNDATYEAKGAKLQMELKNRQENMYLAVSYADTHDLYKL